MTLTFENIESIERAADQISKHGVDDPAIIIQLCTLAKRGLATMPRPIEDAPKDGTRFLAIGPSKDYKGTTYVWPCRWFDDEWTVVSMFLENQPTHFLPYLALEAP